MWRRNAKIPVDEVFKVEYCLGIKTENLEPFMYRLFNVMVKNEETGKVVKMNTAPVLHSEGCTILRKLANYPWRRKYLEEVKP